MNAVFSHCGAYRYRLDRQVLGNGATAVIMVNPSTADASVNDPTIRRLIGFGNRHYWGRIIVGNLFAFRATDVRQLRITEDAIGRENDWHLADICKEATQVIVAWGPVGKQPRMLRERWRDVVGIIEDHGHHPLCIGPVAKCGHPKHPLMLPNDSEIEPWSIEP